MYMMIDDPRTENSDRTVPIFAVTWVLTILRNYRFFFMFISTSTILCLYVFVFSWLNIFQRHKDENISIWKAISKDVLSDILIVYCFIVVWFVGGLTIFHSYLICTNQTTYENFRYRYDKKENPYNKGMVGNIREIFFSKIPPSLNKFRSFVKEDEHVMADTPTSNFGESLVSSKQKIDIEIGSRILDENRKNYSLPEILRNLDYEDFMDDDLKTRDFDPFLSSEKDDNMEHFRVSEEDSFKTGGSFSDEDGNAETSIRISINDVQRVGRFDQNPIAGSCMNVEKKSDDDSRSSPRSTATVLLHK